MQPPQRYHLALPRVTFRFERCHHELLISNSASLSRWFEAERGDRYRLSGNLSRAQGWKVFRSGCRQRGLHHRSARIRTDSFCPWGSSIRDRQSQAMEFQGWFGHTHQMQDCYCLIWTHWRYGSRQGKESVRYRPGRADTQASRIIQDLKILHLRRSISYWRGQERLLKWATESVTPTPERGLTIPSSPKIDQRAETDNQNDNDKPHHTLILQQVSHHACHFNRESNGSRSIRKGGGEKSATRLTVLRNAPAGEVPVRGPRAWF